MSKMGRPRKEIDKESFEKLCALVCSKHEIAAFFGVSHDTLERWVKKTYRDTFASVFDQKADIGRISLRRAQWRKAMEGNVTMMIWLGKQYLGQAEKVEEKVEQEVKQEVTYVSEWGTPILNDSET